MALHTVRRLRTGLLGTAVLIGMVAGCGRDTRNTLPNIIVVISDDHRQDMSGRGGQTWLHTPEIDRLADDGMWFDNAFTTTALCSPSRAGFLTGVYAHRHGVVANGSTDPDPAYPTYAELLQQAGYETAFIGKWHMARWSTPRAGFDHWVSFNGQGNYEDNTLNVDGDWELSPEYLTDDLVHRALAFIATPRDRPFLLVLSHKGVHWPCIPAERHEQLYDDMPLLEGPSVPESAMARRMDHLRRYGQALASIDEGIGRIREKLEELELQDETAVVYTSDSGYLIGEHGGLWDKRAAYEESIRIPMIMTYPGKIERGSVNNDLVLNIDLAPTVLALAAVPAPETMQGRSWLPQNHSGKGRQEFLYEYFEERGKVPTTLAVRTQAWKLITFPDRPDLQEELYHLAEDPYEEVNLAGNPDYGGVLQDLSGTLARLIRETELETSPHMTGTSAP